MWLSREQSPEIEHLPSMHNPEFHLEYHKEKRIRFSSPWLMFIEWHIYCLRTDNTHLAYTHSGQANFQVFELALNLKKFFKTYFKLCFRVLYMQVHEEARRGSQIGSCCCRWWWATGQRCWELNSCGRAVQSPEPPLHPQKFSVSVLLYVHFLSLKIIVYVSALARSVYIDYMVLLALLVVRRGY